MGQDYTHVLKYSLYWATAAGVPTTIRPPQGSVLPSLPPGPVQGSDRIGTVLILARPVTVLSFCPVLTVTVLLW